MTIYAQGDILLIKKPIAGEPPVAQRSETSAEGAPRGSARGQRDRVDGADPVILAEGEITGHHHALWGKAVMFRDDAIGQTVPSDLYIGSVRVAEAGAVLTHPEHDAIALAPGDYEVRRQREYHAGAVRRVQD